MSDEGCSCEAYPQVYALEAARTLGRPAAVHNLGVSGSTSGDLLQSVRGDAAVRAALRQADIVTITIGINDIGSCETGTDTECYSAAVGALGSDLTRVLEEIQALEGDHRYILRATDYYNHVIGKADRAELGASYQALFAEELRAINAAICAAVVAHAGRCVDLLAAFNGPDGNRDPAPLLLPDHVHPSAEGNRVIAAQIAAAGYR
ncbi:MAG: SGNH/GDSL hydrolase family protein [Chloroflexota bacterium]|nr:SGNH/GDSL hydrolase family protein [Chloroflexota bacterium]